MTRTSGSVGFGWSGHAGRIGQRRAGPRWWILSILLAIVAGPFVGLISPARAGMGVAVTPASSPVVPVGFTGVPATLQVVNISTSPDDLDPVTIEPVLAGVPAITLVPSCGTSAISGSGDCSAPDPGVFLLSATALGEVGTACEGTTFTVAVIDEDTGRVSFTPSTPVVLQPPGSPDDMCVIDFTFDVLRVPTLDSQGAPGVQTSQIAFATGRNSVTGSTGLASGTASVTVLDPPVGSIATQAMPTAPLGSPISDTATVTGSPATAPTPTGTVTFTLFGPGDPTCAGTPVFTSPPQPLAGGPPPTTTSGIFFPTSPGTYNWVAVYSGDANYVP